MATIKQIQRTDGPRWIVRLHRTRNGYPQQVTLSFTCKKMAIDFINENEEKYKKYGYDGVNFPSASERGLKKSTIMV